MAPAARAILVDSSAWVAMAHQRDQEHERAVKIWAGLRKEQRQLITTNLVLAESHALILRRLGIQAADAFLEPLLSTTGCRVIWVDAELAGAARDRWLKRFSDQPFTLTDAVSFEVMHREGLREAFTFDHDFRRAGFVQLMD